MLTLLFWMMMHGQAKVATPEFRSMCDRGKVEYQYEGVYAFNKRPGGECFIYEKNVGQVYFEPGPPKHEWTGEQRDGLLIAMQPKHKAPAHKKKPACPPLSGDCSAELFWHNLDASLGRFPAPVEHVIEIRRIEEDAACEMINPLKWSHDKGYHCVKITRELWIDGTRFGVVKGLD